MKTTKGIMRFVRRYAGTKNPTIEQMREGIGEYIWIYLDPCSCWDEAFTEEVVDYILASLVG